MTTDGDGRRGQDDALIDLTTSPHASVPVQVFADIPRPHTQPLVDELRRRGLDVRAAYKQSPLGDERSWGVALGEQDVVTGSMRREREEWRRATDRHVLLTGPHHSRFDVARRMGAGRRARTVHLWGEKLLPETIAGRGLRRGYFGPWYLDGILAVGTRAVDSYRAVTGRDVPVHVLPFVTARGLAIEPNPAVRPTIGFAGRLVPAKGLVLLLRALARMPGSERPRLQVAGAGPEEASLRIRAQRLGIDRWIDWLGMLDGAALDDVRSRWWAQVVPSRPAERWTIVVHEALNSGVPVLASGHVHAASDLVRTGRNGAIVRGEDPERWAGAIGEILDPAHQRECADVARTIGRAFAPDQATPWLLDLLAAAERARRGDGRRLAGRSFVEHVWSEVVPLDLRELTARAAQARSGTPVQPRMKGRR